MYSVGDIIDTYVYREGILNVNYSYSAAVGLFKNMAALILVMSSNWFVKLFDKDLGVW